MTDPHHEQTNSSQQPWSPPPGPGPAQRTTVPAQQPADDSTSQQAKQAAGDVAHDAQDAGRAVADTAKSEASGVKDDAVREGRRLWDETSSTLSSQASDQMQRAAGTVRSFSDDLGRMSRGEQPESGLATDLAGQVTDRTDSLAGWLENHEPSDLLSEVQSFARRRPVAFLAIAAGIGFAAGRLTRGVAQSHMDDSGSGPGPRSGSPQALVERPSTTGGVQSGAGTHYAYSPTGHVPPPPSGAPTVPPAVPSAPVGAPQPVSTDTEPVPAAPGVPPADPSRPQPGVPARPVEPPVPHDPRTADPNQRGGHL